MVTDNDTVYAGTEAGATSTFRQHIEDTEQNVLGSEKHVELEKTEQALHGVLGPYTDWYLLGGTVFVIVLIVAGIKGFIKRRN